MQQNSFTKSNLFNRFAERKRTRPLHGGVFFRMKTNLTQLEERRQEAIIQVKLNCLKLMNLHKYGVKSFYDRLPPFTSSVIKASDGSRGNADEKYLSALTQQEQEYDFIGKMKQLFQKMEDPYCELFFECYVSCKPIKNINRPDKHTILNRGYLKLALLDADIDYNYMDEIEYQDQKERHNQQTSQVIKKMKAQLKSVYTYYLNHNIDLYLNEDTTVIIKNLNLQQDDYLPLQELVAWINEIDSISFTSGRSPKLCVYKFIVDPEWKYLDAVDRKSLLKGILTLAYINHDMNYCKEDIERDAIVRCNSKHFLREIKNFQFSLHLGVDYENK